jgi:hypothetical protein
MLIIYLRVKETMGVIIALTSPIAGLLKAGLLEKTSGCYSTADTTRIHPGFRAAPCAGSEKHQCL